MRSTLVLSALILAAPALAEKTAAPADPKGTCQPVAPNLARDSDKRLMPRKLTQLPPATGYMAVYRKIGGCEAPLTLSDYRRANRR